MFVAVWVLVLVLMRRWLYFDDKGDRHDSALMLELSPTLVQASLREVCVEGEDGTARAHDKAAVLSVFVIAARTVSVAEPQSMPVN